MARLLSRLAAVLLLLGVLLMDGVIIALVLRIHEGYVVFGGLLLGLTVLGLLIVREAWRDGF